MAVNGLSRQNTLNSLVRSLSVVYFNWFPPFRRSIKDGRVLHSPTSLPALEL